MEQNHIVKRKSKQHPTYSYTMKTNPIDKRGLVIYKFTSVAINIQNKAYIKDALLNDI